MTTVRVEVLVAPGIGGDVRNAERLSERQKPSMAFRWRLA